MLAPAEQQPGNNLVKYLILLPVLLSDVNKHCTIMYGVAGFAMAL